MRSARRPGVAPVSGPFRYMKSTFVYVLCKPPIQPESNAMTLPYLRRKATTAHLTMLLLSALLVGCAGKEGPAGITGPAGPQGPAGPGTRVSFTVVIPSGGTATAQLPAAIGTDPLKPPVMSCYITQVASSGTWIVVGDSYSSTSPWCAVTFSGGVWTAKMLDGVVGWTALFVVVY